MKQKNNMRTYALGIMASVLVISIIAVVFAGFVSNPDVNPGIINVYTDQDLVCHWTINETGNVTVNWYKNSVMNRTYNKSCTANIDCFTEELGVISKNYTTKGDTWICEVMHFNGTSNESRNDSVEIVDSVPTSPLIYWYANGSLIPNNTIPMIAEDDSTEFIINSTDEDEDDITYTMQSNSANCDIGSSTGIITCSPTLESHVGLKTLRYRSEDSETGATRGYVNITINITQTNDAPYFSPTLSDTLVHENEALNYQVIGIDDENNIPFNFSISSDLDSLVITNLTNTSMIIAFSNDGQNKASFSDKGNHTVTVTIYDNGTPSRNYADSFNLEVLSSNHNANISYSITNPNGLIQGGDLFMEINASDVDNDTLAIYTNNNALFPVEYSSTDKSSPSGISRATGTINISVLTNNHVIGRSISIIVFDTKENSTVSLTLNITNVNDQPVIYDISSSDMNTLTNTNITNLTGYIGVYFSYLVNATDIDMGTYQGDSLQYYSNDSRFPINISTGILSFTPDTVGNYSVLISVYDESGLGYNKTATISIFPNTNPLFTQDIFIQCYEYDATNYNANCYYNISANVTDYDAEDYVNYYWTNSSLFLINATTGIINFTANQDMIGNYSILLNITDTHGAENSTNIYLIINNTNNPPNINQTVIIPSGRLRIGQNYQITVFAEDEDLNLPYTYENLTFNYTVTGTNVLLFTLTKLSNTEAAISFNPLLASDAGNYTLNVTATDYFNNISNCKEINIFIYNTTYPPNITRITPFGTPFITDSVNTSWMDYANFTNYLTNITISENSSYTFNQTSYADNVSYSNTINYTWYYDGSIVSHAQYINRGFNFFSSGNHNVTFIAQDQFDYETQFFWNIIVSNVNRAPVLVNSLDNLEVNGTTTFNNYMTYYDSETKFIDYDDDLDLDGKTPNSETTLVFDATSCDYAQFTFTNSDLKVQTLAIGECYVNFTVMDADGETVASNIVSINITTVSNDTTPEPIVITQSGGGSSTRTITIPLPIEVEVPKPLQIITPKLVTVYKNASIKVPIVLNNTWNDTLEGVGLSVYTNASNVTLHLDKTYFPRIGESASEEVMLIINNYKSEGHYEIQIAANITDPYYREVATIFVNSADMRSEGEEVENKISFASDLLSSNRECLELNELLNKARIEFKQENYGTASRIIDDVINGCKYLTSIGKSNTPEKPTTEFVKTFQWKKEYMDYIIIGGFSLIFFVSLYYIFKKDKEYEF
jgi:hypothetical protein